MTFSITTTTHEDAPGINRGATMGSNNNKKAIKMDTDLKSSTQSDIKRNMPDFAFSDDE